MIRVSWSAAGCEGLPRTPAALHFVLRHPCIGQFVTSFQNFRGIHGSLSKAVSSCAGESAFARHHHAPGRCRSSGTIPLRGMEIDCRWTMPHSRVRVSSVSTVQRRDQSSQRQASRMDAVTETAVIVLVRSVRIHARKA